MQHVRFGRTGLSVSRLCLGTMTFGGQCDERTSFAIMDAAAEGGITFFDTADMYPPSHYPEGQGRTEEIIGRWLAGRRDQFIVASKCFFPTGRRPWEQGNSRHNIRRAVEVTLRRLGTDYLDLYQIHSWDHRTPVDETLQALDDLVHAGTVRYVGCSNVLAYQLARSLGRAEVLGTVRFDSVQPRYNLLFREMQREMFPLCTEEQIAVIPYNPLAGGFLTGKHRPGEAADGTRFGPGDQGDRYRERYWQDRMFSTVGTIREIAAAAGRSMAELAVAWVLAQPAVTSPIVGATRPEQLTDALRAAASPLDPELVARLDELTYEYRFGDSGR
jgi:aryl-alcohol dehydrogenase (NADP+)